MEKLTPKHNHTLTDILKVCIFAIFLMMPFFTMLPTMLYYGFNEHAKGVETVTEGGWEVTEKFESNEINNVNDIQEGNIYNSEQFILFDDGYYFILDFYYIKSVNFTTVNFNEVNEKQIDNYNANEGNCLEFIYDNGFATMYYTNDNCYLADYYEDPFSFTFFDCDFVVKEGIDDFKSYLVANSINLPQKSEFKVYEINYTEELEVQKNITQLIEKNWNDLWDTNLYKWTNESILKEGLDNFTGVFGITDTSHITNLITYELIIVSVYIVIDIVLKMFTWLTHMIGNK